MILPELTLSLIKPDAVQKGVAGQIIGRFESEGLRVVACKKLWLTTAQARAFYAVHAQRPFYEGLVAFMTEGPIYALILEGEGAVMRNREIMGATDPAKAAPGTLRALFGDGIERNAVHGSDSPENARIETDFFFSQLERF